MPKVSILFTLFDSIIRHQCMSFIWHYSHFAAPWMVSVPIFPHCIHKRDNALDNKGSKTAGSLVVLRSQLSGSRVKIVGQSMHFIQFKFWSKGNKDGKHVWSLVQAELH